jgi:hypothetical protein
MLKSHHRRKLIGVSLAFGVAILLMPRSELLAARGGGNNGETRVEGALVLVNTVESFVQIRVQNGSRVSVKVLNSTKIERNGVRVALSALKIGDRAQARIQTSTNMTTKLESVGP